jgi:hypothetical protein
MLSHERPRSLAHLASDVWRWLLFAAAVVSACGGRVDAEDSRPPVDVATEGIWAAAVSINQGVEIPLSADGPISDAPVVAGRPALVQVRLDTAPDFAARDILAELVVSGAPVRRLLQHVAGPSELFFRLEAHEIKSDSTLEVRLPGARWPASGVVRLDAFEPDALRVVIVPIVANGFAPDTSAPRIAALERRIRAMYPVSVSSFSLRAPVTHAGPIGSDGTGFDVLLAELFALRNTDGPEYGTYYYGLLAPAASAHDFCTDGCIGGLSFKPGAFDDAWRCALGVGHFPDGTDLEAPDVMAHELGHAHGLSHAPCETPDPGPYPHPNAEIGVWGWDFTSGARIPPDHADVMSYCSPSWMSDFNYARISARMRAVANRPDWVAPAGIRAPGRFRSAILGPDGELRWGATLELDQPVSGGELRTIGSIEGIFHDFDHLPGGMLLVRD